MLLEWQTLCLSAVQGLTEFLPVSSSGHLALLQTAFGFSESALAFDILLHCATTLAVLIFFRKDIAAFLGQWCAGLVSKEARTAEGWRYGWAVLAGTVVTAAVALPLEGPVEAAMRSHFAVGAGLLVTAGVLCLAPLLPERKKELSLKAALVVGLVQGLAVFPGVSRSGTTIAAALFMGLTAPEAFRLSFLLSVPAIIGATLLEVPGLLEGSSILPGGWLPALFAAFLLGYFSLTLLRRLVLSGRWAYFGIYCFFLGLAAIVSEVAGNF
ncbi:MAG: undecaprenyl-diphosphate phosphatase [Synergistaceae bacterium]|jgi:undecaprenyl-diphosphatase|nr:undecaprenyl-diphosphate phosphatase [Synergistaceae bacterium]